MSSPFDALDAQASATVMAAFGDVLAAVLTPRLRSEYTDRATDPTRAPRPIRGVFSAGPGEQTLQGNNKGEYAGGSSKATRAAEFWLPAAEVAAVPYPIRVGDLVTLPSRATEPAYAIARIQATDLGDLNLILVAENLPPPPPPPPEPDP